MVKWTLMIQTYFPPKFANTEGHFYFQHTLLFKHNRFKDL